VVTTVLTLACILMIATPAAAADTPIGPAGPPSIARPIDPAWDDGASWTVKVFYRSLSLGKEDRLAQKQRQELDTPVYWVYKVTKRHVQDTHELIRVQVKDKDKRRSEIASLTYARQQTTAGGPRNLSLLRGKFMRSVHGEGERQELKVSAPGEPPVPALTTLSTIPYDFPVLPTGATTGTVFTITEDTGPGGMKYAMDIVQTEFRSPDPDVFMWRGAKQELVENGYPTNGLVGIQLTRDFDGKLVRQLWHPDVPWPLLSYSPWYRTVLVYHSGESPSGSR